MRQAIYITGYPRSGISLYAQLFALSNQVWVGKTKRGKREKRFMEEQYIRDYLVIPFLRRMNIDTLGVHPLKTLYDSHMAIVWKEELFLYLPIQRQDTKWMYADWRVLLVWRMFDWIDSNATWVFVKRDIDKVVNSCLKTDYFSKRMTKEVMTTLKVSNKRNGWLKVITFYDRIIEEIKASGIVNYTEVYDTDTVDELIQKLPITFTDEMVEFLKQNRK